VPKVAGGRTVAYEILLATQAIKTAIREGRTHMIDNIIQTSSEFGMATLESVLAELVKNGSISMETAEAYALRPADIMRFVKGNAS